MKYVLIVIITAFGTWMISEEYNKYQTEENRKAKEPIINTSWKMRRIADSLDGRRQYYQGMGEGCFKSGNYMGSLKYLDSSQILTQAWAKAATDRVNYDYKNDNL